MRSRGELLAFDPTMTTFKLTEAGNAEHFCYHFQDQVRYDHQRRGYLLWKRHRWQPDDRGEVRELILAAVRLRQAEATEINDHEARTKYLKWAIASESRQRLDAIYIQAQSLAGIADSGRDWDPDPTLLGVPNGVVNLVTGELRDGQREDRITMQAGVLYDPEARSPLWDRALSEILVDPAHVAYTQLALGYSITGETAADVWFLCDGSGRNGKGTLLQPIKRALADYAIELPAAVFSNSDREPWELARLPGRRFVLSSESGSLRLNPDRMKQLTGGDSVSASAKYQNSFEFVPISKYWFACNKLPRVTDDSPAFWSRVRRVPFTVSFVGREDNRIRRALYDEESHQRAVLAWLVQGAVRYFQTGLSTAPPAFVKAAEAYRTASDPLADFLADAIEPDAHAEVRADELYQHYRRWAEQQGLSEQERVKSKAFGERMGALYTKYRGAAGNAYKGVARRNVGCVGS